MPAPPVSRPIEAEAVSEFLASVTIEPSALVLEGEAGIGKTTAWLVALRQASERGYRALSATPAAAESVQAYAGLADLLGDVEATVLASLPHPQRIALERVLLRAETTGDATDQRAVAAGFLSVITALADHTPVLLAIDDLQWLDQSSVRALAFAAGRLPQRAGLITTVRTDPDTGGAATWLRLPRPGAVRRLQVCPLSLGGLHAVLRERTGRPLSRPTLVRIHEISGGNPFYAIELARAMGDSTTDAEVRLSGTLAQLVRARIGRLEPEVRDVLLAASCPAEPTIELIAGAIGAEAQQVLPLLKDAAANGIVVIDGCHVRFAHPLLAHGVYVDAAPARRRQMHRRMADLVDQPELLARHLALAATGSDPDTLDALDAAAEMAHVRGAPAAAAEFLDMATRLGGDTPTRRIRLAAHHFNSGDTGRARTLLEDVLAQLMPGALRAEASNLLAMVRLYADSFIEAARLLEHALAETGVDLALRVQMRLTLSMALLNLGDVPAAVGHIDEALGDVAQLDRPQLMSQVLGMRVALRFLNGEGLDEPGLARALELEDLHGPMPLALRPSMYSALLAAWTGQLARARDEMSSIRRRCLERGEENELMYVGFYALLLDIWLGDFRAAGSEAEIATEQAQQLGGDLALCVALTMRAATSAYAGRVDETRRDATAALAASQRGHSFMATAWATTVLGFLEVALGNYDTALATFEPLLSVFDTAGNGTEIYVASFVPDAVEAMVHLDQLDEAGRLVGALERNGRRLDRAWMLAVGGRCRGMLHAAQGDVDAAERSAEQAMVEHDRLPMPFERARTQLLLGQLQRRQRRKDAGAATIREALATFESLGTPLWAERARAELARANIGPRQRNTLTPSEQRVAELAASGLTNREVAGELFISSKTVEGALARVYQKLGIRSRAELGRRMTQTGE